MKNKLLFLATSVIIMASILTGCNSPAKTTEAPKASESATTTEQAKESEQPKSASKESTPLAKIKEKGELVIGTSAEYEPFEYHAVVNGKDKIVGFDIDIANTIAADLGVKLKIEDMSFDTLLVALNSGKVDIVIAGMNPTDERKKNVDFSDSYYKTLQNVIVRKEDAAKFTSVDSFKDVKVAVQKGSVQEQTAIAKLPTAKLDSLQKVPDLVLNLKSKRVEAVVLDSPVAQKYIAANPDLAISGFTFPDDGEKGYAIAFRKNSTDLLDAVNKTLAKMKQDGSMDKLIKDNFAK